MKLKLYKFLSDNKIYIFKECNYVKVVQNLISAILTQYPGETFDFITPSSGEEQTLGINDEGYLTRNGIIVENLYLASLVTPNLIDRVKIFEYDEIENTFTIVKCGWKYSNGKINGCVTLNNRGEHILTICEYGTNKMIPLKHININTCSFSDDESIYTQTPKIPISNVSLKDYYAKPIPKGVYQFFIRYKIRKGFYTPWCIFYIPPYWR